MSLQLQIGRYYVNGYGEVHGPLRIDPKYPDRFTDKLGNWYGDDGHYWAQTPPCRASLLREVSGKQVYESDLQDRPNYHTGQPRKTWEQLGDVERWSWER